MDDEQAPKQLIVEGQDDRQAVVELMRSHISAWPKIGKVGAPVIIRLGHSVDEILSNKYLQGNLKTASLQVLGVMLDADGGVKAEDRYASVRDQCIYLFASSGKSVGNFEAGRIPWLRQPAGISSFQRSLRCVRTFVFFIGRFFGLLQWYPGWQVLIHQGRRDRAFFFQLIKPEGRWAV